jgi:autotransporter-associated beta strand protein
MTTNSGGVTAFIDNSTGGNARFITNGTGNVDFEGSSGPAGDGRITAGSIEGSGLYFIGAGRTLVVGGNNMSTEVSGVIADVCGCSPQGSGSFEKVGTGTLTLSGVNTYTGGTTIAGGTLRVENNSALGSGAVTTTGSVLDYANGINLANPIIINSNTTQLQVLSGSATQSGLISELGGPRPLEKIGAGTLVLSGNNTYSGGTTLSAGTLQLGVDAVFNVVGQPASGIVTSAIGTGTLTFNGGRLQSLGFSERAIANAVHITANGGTIDSGSGFFRITGDITDAPGASGGRLTFESIAGGGLRLVALSGNNTYSGVTYIDSGTVLTDSSTALSPNSAFQVNTGATLTLSSFSNSIASLADGTAGGGVVQNASASGTATLTITGLSGATASFSGVLRDGVGGESGGGGPVLAIVKNGLSRQIFAGTNHYTGTTTVNGGVLEVDGSIASSSLTTVNANAALTGIGTIGNTTIANAGIFAPGNGTPGSSMTVSGSLALQSGAQYLVMLNPATSSFANVTGTATLGGATVNAVYANGSYISRQYTILTAGSVSGTFSSLVNTNLPANFSTSLSYDPTHAYLNLALSFTPGPNFGGGLNINQQNVANTLINFFNTTGGIPAVFGSLSPAGLTKASGEVATGSQQTTFDAMGLFIGLLSDPFVAGRGDGVSAGGGTTGFAEESYGVSAYAPNDRPRSNSERDAYAAIYRKAPPMVDIFTQRWSVWAAGYGGSQTTDGNAVLGSNTATSRVYGTAIGADYRFSPNTLAGFVLAGGGTSFNIANGLSTGRSDLFQAGAFIRHNAGPAYLSAALAYGWQDITTDRIVTIAGVDRLRAEFNANAWSGRVEGGYRFVAQGIGLTPYAAGQFTTFELPNYAETVVSGGNTFALTYGAKSVTASRSELGLRTDKSFAMQDSIFTLRGRAAWAHNFNADRNVLATFQTLPGASFVVNGAGQATEAALVTGSAEIKWLNGFSLAATFEGEFSNVTRSYAGKGVARYAW